MMSGVTDALREGAVTQDLGGELTTAQVGDQIARALETVPAVG